MEAVGEALKSRALELFKCVMLTAFELLCWDEKSKLAHDLSQELTDDEEVFVTMLFNDEVHTYEQVREATELHRFDIAFNLRCQYSVGACRLYRLYNEQ